MTLFETRIGAWLPGIALSGLLAVGCSQAVDDAQSDEGITETMPEITMTAPPQTPDTPDQQAPSDVAATVNGHPILLGEVRAIFDQYVRQQGHQVPAELSESQWQMQLPVLLEVAVGQHLIQEEIKTRGLTADDDAIEARYAEIIRDIPEGQTLEQLTGRSAAEIRQLISEMLAFEKLLDAYDLAADEPTDEQVQAFYDENPQHFDVPESIEARHILITVNEADDDEAREAKHAQITAIRQQLLDGADFADLAAAHSDCPSGQRGGNLGTFGRDQMAPAFEAAAFSQQPGKIGPVIQTDFGYHIIQVIQTQDAHEIPLDEARDQIIAHMREQSRQEKQQTLINKLKAQAEIEYFMP